MAIDTSRIKTTLANSKLQVKNNAAYQAILSIIDALDDIQEQIDQPITESSLILADNTINDVSTDRHGFAPKAPGDSDQYLNGLLGTWGPLVVKNIATPTTPSTGEIRLFSNTSKKFAYVDDAGNVTIVGGGLPLSYSNPSNPTGTTNLTGVMMGLAATITPTTTGRVFVVISGDVQNNTVNDGIGSTLRWGTGTAPINGAALTGTILGSTINSVNKATSTTSIVPVTLSGIVTGLTLNTAIWVDVALNAITGGTATLKDLSVSLLEL